MSMSFEFKRATGLPGPIKALKVEYECRWYGQTSAFILGMTGRLMLGNDTLGTVVEIEPANHRFNDGRPLENDERARINISVLIPDVSMAAIEKDRRKREGDVHLLIKLSTNWGEAVPRDSGAEDYNQKWFTGTPRWEDDTASIPIPQSEWIKRLREMEWEERRLFEIPVLPAAGANDEYQRAVELLGEAREQYRIGKYKECLFNCRSALESMAKYENPDDKKAGFESIFARAFPEGNGDKSKAVNELVKKLSEFLHLARHEDSPHTLFEREETEFGLITTLALFEAVGGRLASNK